MKKIKLTRGKWAIVDSNMFKELNSLKWFATKQGRKKIRFYATRKTRKEGCYSMHRYIMKAKKGQAVDHINRNTLDNRMANLRFCNQSQNMANSIGWNSKSGYRGVRKIRKTFQAYLKYKRNFIHIGTYKTAKEAAIAYDAAANVLHGKFSSPNFKQI